MCNGKDHFISLLCLFQGQWWGDVFNGEGSLIHSSGMSYEGMWVSGHPEGTTTVIGVL